VRFGNGFYLYDECQELEAYMVEVLWWDVGTVSTPTMKVSSCTLTW
jgi:hypothetical protein